MTERSYRIVKTNDWLSGYRRDAFELYLTGPCVGGYVDPDGRVWLAKAYDEATVRRKGEIFVQTGVIPCHQKEAEA